MPTIFLRSPYSDRRRLNINFCDHPGFTQQEQMFNPAISNGLRSLAEKSQSYFLGSKSKRWLNKLDAVLLTSLHNNGANLLTNRLR